MNDFYEEPKKLNMKKVIIISIIFIVIIISMIVMIANKISAPKNDVNVETPTAPTSTVFYSKDKSISVELSNSFNLKQYNSDYLIELRSPNNLDIFISKENKLDGKELIDIVNADKIAFMNNFSSYSNLSETKELSVNNNQAYTYSFHYLDSTLNKAFYLQIVWLQIENNYYIFDIEFPLDDLSFNTNIASSVLASFKENK